MYRKSKKNLLLMMFVTTAHSSAYCAAEGNFPHGENLLPLDNLRGMETAEQWVQNVKKDIRKEVPGSMGKLIKHFAACIEPRTSDDIKYISRAAIAGDVTAMFLYAYSLEDGEGVEKDANKACEYFIRAAERGCQRSEKELKKKDSYNEKWLDHQYDELKKESEKIKVEHSKLEGEIKAALKNKSKSTKKKQNENNPGTNLGEKMLWEQANFPSPNVQVMDVRGKQSTNLGNGGYAQAGEPGKEEYSQYELLKFKEEHESAFEQLSISVGKEYVKALYTYGMGLLQEAESEEWGIDNSAFTWLRSAANKGHEESMYQLAVHFIQVGTEEYKNEAIIWLYKLDKLGDGRAKAKLDNINSGQQKVHLLKEKIRLLKAEIDQNRKVNEKKKEEL